MQKIRILALRAFVKEYLEKDATVEVFQYGITLPSASYVSLKHQYADNSEVIIRGTKAYYTQLDGFTKQLEELVKKHNPHIIVPHPYLSKEEMERMKALKTKTGEPILIAIVSGMEERLHTQLECGAHEAFVLRDKTERTIIGFSDWLQINHDAIIAHDLESIQKSEKTKELLQKIAEQEAQDKKDSYQVQRTKKQRRFYSFLRRFTQRLRFNLMRGLPKKR